MQLQATIRRVVSPSGNGEVVKSGPRWRKRSSGWFLVATLVEVEERSFKGLSGTMFFIYGWTRMMT